MKSLQHPLKLPFLLTFSIGDNQFMGIEIFHKDQVSINCEDVRDGVNRIRNLILTYLIKMIRISRKYA